MWQQRLTSTVYTEACTTTGTGCGLQACCPVKKPQIHFNYYECLDVLKLKGKLESVHTFTGADLDWKMIVNAKSWTATT